MTVNDDGDSFRSLKHKYLQLQGTCEQEIEKLKLELGEKRKIEMEAINTIEKLKEELETADILQSHLKGKNEGDFRGIYQEYARCFERN